MEFEEEPMINHTPQVKKIEELPNPSLETRSEPGVDNTDVKTGDVDNQPVETIKKEYKPLPTIVPTKPEPKKKPEPLNNMGNYPILEKPKKKYFWKIYAIAITIIIILAIVGLVFLVKDGKLNPQFNFTANPTYDVDVNPTINTPITNDYENTFNNSIEINFDLSDEFIEKVCGNSP